MLKQCLHRSFIICKESFTSISNQPQIKSTDIRYFRSIVERRIPRISILSSRPFLLDLKETSWPSRHYSTKSGVFKESKSMKKSKVSGGGSDGMHQTKLGQFFKKSTTPSADSPVKKENGKDKDDKVDVEVRDVGNGKSAAKSEQKRRSKSPLSEDEKATKKSSSSSKVKPEAKSGQKRRTRSPSSEDEKVPKKSSNSSKVKPEAKSGRKRRSRSSSPEDEKVTKKSSSSGKVKPEAKKQRRRVIVAESSSEDESAMSKDAVFSDDDGDHKAIPVKKKKGSSSRESTPVNKNGSSEEKKQSGKTEKNPEPEAEVKLKSTKDASDKKPEKAKDEKKSQPSPKNKSSGGSVLAAPKGWKPDYNPAKNKYHPIDDASWEKGERVPYLALAKTLEAIEATSSRLKNIEILANYFRSVMILSPDDMRLSVYLCLNKLAPAYEGVELGVAETNVMKAIAQATGRSFDKIKSDAAVAGDLGIVAENSRSTQKTLFQPQPLTVNGVFHKLKEVAGLTGSSSHGKKISMITSLLVACKYSEARYLARSLLGKLRIGLAEQSLLQAIAQACVLTPPDQDLSEWPPKFLDRGKKLSTESLKSKFEEEAYKVKSAFCECPNYDILVKALQENGTDSLAEQCKLTPGIPPRPMLAQPTKGVADVLERFDGIKFTCEYKYDGERAQVHLLENGKINIYSRNQENNTSKYPDIISRFSKCIKGNVTSCILDTEAVAWDIEKQSILPFQVLSTRKRKDADETEIKVQVCLFTFDLIYLNGKSLIKEPLIKRRELLREHFQAVTGEFVFATSLDTESMEEVQEFLEESVKGNCEGLMVKTLDEKASYELAKRSQKWLKLKKDYLDSGGDSLDLVVIGGFLGKGKRTGNYGGYLLACYDPDEEVYQTICKLGTGFSDEQLHQHAESLKPHIIPNPKSYYRFNTQLTPDHWFDAVQVWEVKCADLSLSPVHTAAEGMADPQRGISLRFPRFIRIRDDKKIEDATSASQVAEMYKSQEVVKNSTEKKRNNDEDDFY